jgi:hypothetical protein
MARLGGSTTSANGVVDVRFCVVKRTSEALPPAAPMISAAGWDRSANNPRRKQILQANAPEQFCSDAVGHTIDDIRAVL